MHMGALPVLSKLTSRGLVCMRRGYHGAAKPGRALGAGPRCRARLATRKGTGGADPGFGIVGRVKRLLQWLRRPRLGVRALAAACTVLALLPLQARLPRVAVVACFDSGHPLYQWVPNTAPGGAGHCVTAPTAMVGWTLMIAATLVVQVVLLPFLIAAAAMLMRGARELARSAGEAIAAALVGLSGLGIPQSRPVPVPVTAAPPRAGWSRENPRRGPPSRLF